MSFDELTAVAAVGTGKRALDAVPVDVPERADAPQAPALRLLDAAAAMSVVRRGRVAAGSGNVPPPAPEETLPEPPPAFVTALVGLRGEGAVRSASDRAALLVEALGWLRDAGGRLPHRTLAGLLAHPDPRVRQSVHAVSGERGAWLTAVLGTERAAPRTPTPEAWELGTKEERLAYLREVRANDPDAARDLLAEAWPTLAADARAAMVEALAPPVPADEPFLERALDDRAKGVRMQAALLLRHLPGSAYAARARERLRRWVTYAHGEVTLSSVRPDAADARDGVSGPVVHLPMPLLLGVPPGAYPDLLGASLDALATADGPQTWAGGLLDAADSWSDPALAGALVRAGRAHPSLARVVPEADLPHLVATSPPAELAVALERVRRPWPEPLVVAVAGVLSDPPAPRKPYPSALARLLAVSVRPEVAGVWAWRVREYARMPQLSDAARREVLGAAGVLTVRDTLWTAIRPMVGRGSAEERSGVESKPDVTERSDVTTHRDHDHHTTEGDR